MVLFVEALLSFDCDSRHVLASARTKPQAGHRQRFDAAAFAALRLPCAARSPGPSHNSLRSLRSLRSNRCDESDDEARQMRARPEDLALQAAPALASRPLARRSRAPGSPASGLACSGTRPGAELTALTSFASFRQPRRVRQRGALRARPRALCCSAPPRRAPACPDPPLREAVVLVVASRERGPRARRCPPGAICGAARSTGLQSARAARFVI